jgi:hypothetical protein
VRFLTSQVQSDEDGRFRLEAIPAGGYLAFAAAHGAAQRSREIEVHAPAESIILEFVEPAAAP